MEGTVDSGALGTLIDITGASPSVGARLLQASGGDLNAAVNSFFNDGDEPLRLQPRDDIERNDWMDEDEPAVAIPVESVAPYRPINIPVSPWDEPDLASSGMIGIRSPAFGTGGVPQVTHSRVVRDVPIEWPDDDDDDDAPSYPRGGFSNPRIEEIPSDVEVQQVPTSDRQAMIDDGVPSTASSVFGPGGDPRSTRRFGGPDYDEQSLDPDYNPNAPRIAEVPIMAGDEGIDIEEEMLRAAIEASKREAEEATRRGAANYSQEAIEGGNSTDRPPPVRTAEDDDLARAVTLSLKTAEEEKALRERGGAPSEPVFMQEDEDSPFSEDVRKLDSMRRRGVARDRSGVARGSGGYGGVLSSSSRDRDQRSSGSSVVPIISSPDEVEVEEQPLLRRRTSRRAVPVSTADSGLLGEENQVRSPIALVPLDPRESPVQPSASDTASRDEVGGATHPQQNEDVFPADEWGGISSEEHEEAVMLEALFGGIPERAGLALPYHGRHGMHPDVMSAIAGGEGMNFVEAFNRRGFPQPPSPTVVAQRLIREQQDDEYLASLRADREKELKAVEEEVARRLREKEAAEAAASHEKLLREEELKLQQEAENLEKQLALKKESLPMEPSAEEQGTLTLVVRLPDGSRRGRRFYKSDKLQSLFDFIDVGGGVKPGSYRLVRQYPRFAFTDAEHNSSLETVGLTSKQEVLFLELI